MFTLGISKSLLCKRKKNVHICSFIFLNEIVNSFNIVQSTITHNSIIQNHLQQIDCNSKFYIEPQKFQFFQASQMDDYDYIKDIFDKNVINDYGTNKNLFDNEMTTSLVKHIKEYEIFTIEFHRVETPFIIGIWIFFASVAKIGKKDLIKVLPNIYINKIIDNLILNNLYNIICTGEAD